MSQELEKYLQNALLKLEKAYEDHLKTKVYDKDCEKLKILAEMVKEQLPNENPRPSAR